MQFKTILPRAQADTFNTAVFRYLELRAVSPLDEIVVIESEPQGEYELMSVRLGSEEAAQEFENFWCAYFEPPPPYTFGEVNGASSGEPGVERPWR